MTFFRVLWGIDLVVAAIAVAFFCIGIADGSVSSFNIVLWVAVLAGVALVVLGSRALSRSGRRGPAIALAAVLAVPALLFGLMMATLIVGGVRWN
jgi:hypothetical protein